MTCVAGLVENGRVYMGADSAGVAGLGMMVRDDEKVFLTGPFLMGFTSSFRMGQLLRFQLKVPAQTDDQDDYAFMVTTFVEAVRDCLKKGGYSKVNNNVEEGGKFLVGYRGLLYFVDLDFQVGKPVDPFAAVGCGDDIALGALYATQDFGKFPSATERIRIALKAAERMSAGVRGPFVILNDAGERCA